MGGSSLFGIGVYKAVKARYSDQVRITIVLNIYKLNTPAPIRIFNSPFSGFANKPRSAHYILLINIKGIAFACAHIVSNVARLKSPHVGWH